MKKNYLILLLLGFLFVSTASAQWTTVTTTGTTFILYGMHFPSDQNTVGYACGMQYTYDADGVIVKTTDGGETWSQIWPTSGTIDGLQGIWFLNDLEGFACGWNNYFIKTTDGGATWTPITVGTDVWYYKDVEFFDDDNGVAIASMNSVASAAFITSDGGNTWAPATSGAETSAMMGISYAAEDTIYAAGTDAVVRWSTDGGHNWSIKYTLPGLLFGLDFANSDFGLVGGEEDMYATTDGGDTWQTYTTGYENFYGCKAFTDGTGYIGGTDARIWYTDDFGANWTLDNPSATGSIYRIRTKDDGTLFSCASQGVMLTKEAAFSVGFTADNQVICEGDMVNFTDLSSGSVTSWDWTFEGGTPGTSTMQNPGITYNTAGTYDVTLEISNGVVTDQLTMTDYITVNAIPGTASTPTGPTATCSADLPQYTTTAVPYATSYEWEVDPLSAGSMSGNGTSATFYPDPVFTGAYDITVRAVNSCGDGAWSGALTCTVAKSPDLFFLMGDGPYCEGEPGTELTTDGSETGIEYELYLEGSPTGITMPGTGSGLNFGYVTGPGNYTCYGSNTNCEEMMNGQVYVFMKELPEQPGIPSGPDNVCSGSTSTYSVEEVSFADDLIWTLNPVNAGTMTPNGTEVEIVWAEDFYGTANLSVHGDNECGTGPESDALEISANAAPDPEISGLETVCNGYSEEYHTVDNPGSTYAWEVTGGTITAGAGTYMITILWGDPGQGTVVVTESIGEDCEGIAEVFNVTIDDCTGIDEELFNAEVRIQPIPAGETLTIVARELPTDHYTVVIYSNVGQVVLSKKMELTAGQKVTMNIGHLERGMYILKMQSSESGVIAKKILKD